MPGACKDKVGYPVVRMLFAGPQPCINPPYVKYCPRMNHCGCLQHRFICRSCIGLNFSALHRKRPQGEFAEAILLLERALPIRMETLGGNHPETLDTQKWLELLRNQVCVPWGCQHVGKPHCRTRLARLDLSEPVNSSFLCSGVMFWATATSKLLPATALNERRRTMKGVAFS